MFRFRFVTFLVAGAFILGLHQVSMNGQQHLVQNRPDDRNAPAQGNDSNKPRERGVDPRSASLPSWFFDLDRDADGQIALHEWRKGGRKLSEFREFDLNNDGLITAEELLRNVNDPSELKFVKGLAQYQGALETTEEKYRNKSSFKILTIKLEHGTTYQIDQISKVFQSFLYLEDADGNLLKENSSKTIGGNSRIVFESDRSGMFRIVATSLGGFRTGAFQLSVRVVGGHGGSRATGVPSWFKELDKDGDGQIALHEWRERGRKLAEFREWDLNGDGLITAEEALRRLKKPFELKLDKGQAKHLGSFEKPAEERYRGRNVYTVFTVKLERGKIYQIDHVSKAFDAYLYLEDADGELLAEDDDGGGNLNARIVHRASRTGTHRLIASSLGDSRVGAFSLSVRVVGGDGGSLSTGVPMWFKELDRDGDGQIALHEWRERGRKLTEFREWDLNDDGLITAEEAVRRLKKPFELKLDKGQAKHLGSLEPPAERRYRGRNVYTIFTVKLERGKTYQIDHMSKAFDAYLFLENADGELLAEDDDGGGGLNSRIVHRAARTGVFRLIASSLGDSRVGAFSLSVRVVGGLVPEGLPTWFSQLDKDGDGQIALHEWREGGRKLSDFREWDLNDDGIISVEEVLRCLSK